MLLRCVTLENFKTFKGVHEIGVLRSYTSVKLASNRSKKRDFLDAITFLLGQKLSSPSKATKLIYCAQNGQTASSCSVSAEVLIRNDHVEAGVVKVDLKRTLLPDKLLFFVDGDSVSEADYLRTLSGMNANVNSGKRLVITKRNVNEIMYHDSEDVLAFFEEISGSIRYKKECKDLRKQIIKLKEKMSLMEALESSDDSFNSLASPVTPVPTKLMGLRLKLAETSKKFENCNEIRSKLLRTLLDDVLLGMNIVYGWMYDDRAEVKISEKCHGESSFPNEIQFRFSKLDGNFRDFKELLPFDKFLATLSFLFAVTMREETGILILDEIDRDFRDYAHSIVLKRFASLLKKLSASCQILVVSRNKEVCKKAKAMVELEINKNDDTSFAIVYELRPIIQV